MAQVTSGLVAPKGLNKEEVNYRLHEKCASCMYFYYPNSCEIVDGNISPDAVCNKWEIKPKKEPMDGEFYQNEYNKAQAE
jgi:hypothetical protein